MNNQKGLTLVFWIIALVGMFFLARGMTGKVIMSSYSASDYCIEDKECSTGKICCYYEAGRGMCGEPQICEEISLFAREEPKAYNYSADIGLGLLILISILIALYGATRNQKKAKRISKRKKR